jgi:hypothetical protein
VWQDLQKFHHLGGKTLTLTYNFHHVMYIFNISWFEWSVAELGLIFGPFW